MVAGLSAGGIAGWTSLPLGILVAGLLILAMWLLLWWQFAPQQGQSWWRRRSLQTSTNAILVTLAVITILGGINVLAVRYPTRIDLTETKLFSLAPQSRQVVESLKNPLTVFVFDSNPDPKSRTLLQQYQQIKPELFQFEFINPQAEPGKTLKYGIRNPGDIALEMGDRTKKLAAPLSEAKLTPAIASLGSERQPQAYVIQGHGELLLEGVEESVRQAVDALEQEGVVVNSLNLGVQKQIPKTADVLIVAGPKRPFLSAEVTLLETYLHGGGNLLLLVDPETDPNLDEFLKRWGVELDPRLVIDPTSSTPAWPLILDYGDHPITKTFAQRLTFFPEARAIITQEQSDSQITELLRTNPATWAEADPKGDNLKPDPERDLQGPLTLGVAIAKSLTPRPPKASDANQQAPASTELQPNQKQARLVVIGDSDFVKSAFFAEELNSDLFLNAVNWLSSDRDDPALSIRPKEPKNRRLPLTPEKGRLLSWVGLGLLPLGAFSIAAALWWQRR
jgi:ABC-type uncharacterized transport system involved in gliding motility auxiliary subunit